MNNEHTSCSRSRECTGGTYRSGNSRRGSPCRPASRRRRGSPSSRHGSKVWQCSEGRVESTIQREDGYSLHPYIIPRLNLVNTWFSHNKFFIFFFTGTAFILFNYIIKLVLEYQFNLQNPRKQKKMWIFETNKNPLFNISLGMFSKNEVKNHVL